MVSYTIGVGDTLNLHMNGSLKSVRRDHPKYDEILEALQAKDWEALPDLVDPAASVERDSYGLFRVQDGQVVCKDFDGRDFVVPSGLDSEILKYQEMGLDFARLVKFAQRLNDNPSFRSVNQLFNWVKRAGLTITEEGKLIGYRGVMRVRPGSDVHESVSDAEFVDWYTKSFDNSIGKEVAVKRNQVDENPNQSCSHGLHVASYSYAHGFMRSSGPDGAVLFVEVCPSDVVAVPESETDKMRVCRFILVGESEGPIDAPTWDPPRAANPEVMTSYGNPVLRGDLPEPPDSYDKYEDEDEDEWYDPFGY